MASESNSPTLPRSILLLGAGELGLSIIRAVANHPKLSHARLTVLLRPESLAHAARLDAIRALAPRELVFVSSDLGTAPVAEIAALIRDGAYDTVVGCSGVRDAPGAQVKIAEAVYAAGTVERYVPWQFGHDYDRTGMGPDGMYAAQRAVRERLRAYGAGGAKTEWTVVTVGMFLGLLFVEDPYGIIGGLEAARKKKAGEVADGEVVVRALGGWENELTVTRVEDIGRAVAEILVVGGALPLNDRGGRIVYVAGDTFSYGRLADTVEKVLGRKVRRETLSVEFLEEAVRKEPENRLLKYKLVFARGDGASWEKAKSFNAVHGLEFADIESVLRARLLE